MRLTVLVGALVLWSAAADAGTSELKLYVFDCGLIGSDDISPFSLTADETPVRELFVPCYLVEHPKGRMVWDTGLPLTMAGKGRLTEGSEYHEYATSFIDQLAAMGLTPADIDLIAFSHMHYDHVGAANAFTRSKLLIQDAEYEAAFGEDVAPYFVPALYEGLAGNERLLLSGDHDVFGDGSVVIISAPGHTPGHQALLLRLAHTGNLVLSGDLYHFRASRRLRRAPVFNWDAEATFRSMDKVEALLVKEHATLWIEHDKALAETLELAPNYYD
jgi:glyoxylase-like metal-dependent hydrolase (beta-lactamase superfamily II)